MWNFSLLAATRSIETSMPFVLYRFMIYLAISLALLLGTLAGAGTMIAFASFSANPSALANLGAMIGFLGVMVLLYKFRGSALFNVKAGSLALMVEQTRVANLPEGKAQIEFAKKAAGERFTPATFFETSDALRKALQSLASPECPMLSKIGSTGLQSAANWLTRRLAGLCSQAIMALSFVTPDGNPWRAVERGLIIHARHAADLLKFRLYGLLFEGAGLIAAYTLMLYPVDAAISALPVNVGVWRYVFALAFAWTLEGAFFSPIANAAMVRLYLDQDTAPPADADAAALSGQSDALAYIHSKAA